MKKLSIIVLIIALVSSTTTTAFASYGFAYSSGASFGGTFGSNWGFTSYESIYSPPSNTSYNTTTSSNVSSAEDTDSNTDYSLLDSPHNYGIEGYAPVPSGAIGVADSSGAGLMCLEGNLTMWTMGPMALEDGETTIYDSEGNEIGEIVLFDAGPDDVSWQVDYGYLYPERMFQAGQTLYDECIPSWYSPVEIVVLIEYEWDPALNISSSSTATAETLSCADGYALPIKIADGTVRDANNNENLYYKDPFTISYNSSKRKLSYGPTGAVVGFMDDDTGTTGTVCARIKVPDEPAPQADPEPSEPVMTTGDPAPMPEGYYAYNDVPAGEWFFDGVVHAQDAGWVKVADSFKPNDNMTRCEFAKVLMNAREADTSGSHDAEFGDVPSSHWGFSQVMAGKAAGYWGGTGDGDFGCNSPVTREQAAKMIANAADLVSSDEDAFTPGDKYSTWALPFIRRMHAKSYMTGSGNNYNAQGNLTRAEAITVFFRIFGS